MTVTVTGSATVGLNRRILGLALPSLGPMFAQPLMIMADSAMIGHLGTAQLAGLTLASSIMSFLMGLYIFLLYTTTAVASRCLGEGDRAGAVKTGIDGIWLGLLMGLLAGIVVFLAAPFLVSLFASTPAATTEGILYLRAAAGSMVGESLLLAGMGATRGLLDARTPLLITSVGAGANVVLNAGLIYGAGLGVMGAGLGTTLAATGMGVAFARKVVCEARLVGVSLHPSFRALFRAMQGGIPLLIRTLTMQVVIMGTLWVAASFGEVAVAGRQIAANTWALTANLLDSLAVAAQALIGFELGRAAVSGNRETLRVLLRRISWWGFWLGVALGVLVGGVSGVLPLVFSSDRAVHEAARAALQVSAVALPLAGVVFAWDGILIGANDTRYLAWAGLLNLCVYAPALVVVWMWAPAGLHGITGLSWLWVCYCSVFFLSRLATLGLRLRRDSWMRLPAR